jgi:predicted O-linked N-acetylglucosamine transferase (SPINDLY family)
MLSAEPHQNALENLSIAQLIDTASRYTAMRQIEPARQLYRDWINLNPTDPLLFVAHFNCSALDTQSGDAQAAMASLRQTIALNANFMPAYINLGGLLERAGAQTEALELWRSVVNHPAPINGNAISYVTTALKQMARVLSDNQQLEPAETAVQLCLDIDPRRHDVVEQYVAFRLAQCKWPVVVGRENIDRKTLVGAIHPLSTSVYTDDPLLQLATTDRYVRLTTDDARIDRAADRRNAKIDLKNRRLRVGYVSSDLRDHAIGYLMAEFFELHDRSKTEVFAYYCGVPSTSELTNRIQAAVDHWSDIRSLSDDDAARKIAQDGIDILVDINGHTRDSRTGVFARRPAPVQVNWLGYPGTMATPYHHYIIADDWIIPPESEIYYSEHVVRLPCYQPNDRKRIIAARPTRKDAGLPDNAIVYCCFNGTHKISRFTFDRWMEILRRVPGSVLWLLDTSESTKQRLGEFAESKGVSRTRVIFAQRLSNPYHLARYALADLFLDTSPYGAHTTASDALWCGVPVLTLSGRSFASRVCGSLVRAAGLDDLVVTRPEDYVARAVALGSDRRQIDDYKKKLEAERGRCRLFDTDLLAARIEDLYRTMARAHNKGLTPQPNLVNLDAYHEAGTDFDHEETEMLTVADYRGFYKAKLAERHLLRPMQPDHRLWTADDILCATGMNPSRAASRATSARPKRKVRPAPRRRKADKR